MPRQTKILLITLALYFHPLISLAADSCPSIEAVREGNFAGWRPLYSPDDTPASEERIKRFEQTALEFYLAEWSDDYAYGSGRCYYFSGEEVSLAKLTPEPSGPHWLARHDVKQCDSRNVEDCQF